MEELLVFVTENFWLLFLILSLLLMKHHRLAGIALLATQVIWGFIPWVCILTVTISISSEIIRWHALGGFHSAPERRIRRNPDEY